MKLLVLFILLNFSISAALMAQNPIKIACVGNSITSGPGQTHPESYPLQLQAMLGDAYHVRNFGVSGRTLLKKGDFPYWNEPEMEQVKAFRPDILLIKLGTNDSKPQNWQYRDDFKQDYLELIAELKKDMPAKGKIYIVFPVPVTADNFGIRESILVQEMRPILLEVMKEAGIEAIDLYTPLQGRGDLLPDGVHPNTEGLKIMATTIYNKLIADKE
jgi:acyl-CoA thioesterase I